MSDHPVLRHDVRITDTTLRDGSHAMSHQFTEDQVRVTVHALDRAGVEVIEVTHGDGLGGSSFNYGFSREDDLVLIAAAGHALTRKRTVDAAALAREVWLLREEGSGTRATTLELMATLGVEPAQVLTLGSNGSVRQGAIVGLGITLLSEQAVARELASGIVARIPAPGLPLRRPWYALYPGPTVEAGTAALTMAARTFVAFLRSREAKRALTAALGAPIHRLNVNRTAKKSR